jgi:heme-degrading monooxygenase HmoA
VDVTSVDSRDAWQAATEDAAFSGEGMPFAAHPGLYEAVVEDGTPDGDGGVILIDAFEVPPEADERFAGGWDAARRLLSDRRGYLGTRLHRSVGPADFRFVDVARWSSPLMFSRALQRDEFRAAAETIPFRSHPALYQPA